MYISKKKNLNLTELSIMSVNFAVFILVTEESTTIRPYQPLASLVDVIDRYIYNATSDLMQLEKKNLDYENAKLWLDHCLVNSYGCVIQR